WPIPSNNRGSEFKNQKEILSHLGGESTGLYIIVERIFRIETTHFTSGQYQHCGAPGMEVHGSPPAYGWSSDFFCAAPRISTNGDLE
ncbi:hypothetical protein FJR63_23900, partial [Salmonella enterica]